MMKKSGKITFTLSLTLVVTILSAGVLLGFSGGKEELEIIFVRVPAAAKPQATVKGKQRPMEYRADGSQIVRLKSGGDLQVLTTGFYAACDPAVSFDGRTILFAGKRKQGDRWQIWRMDAHGGNEKQITKGNGDSVSPLFVGSLFHLNDKTPTRKIVYQLDNHLYISDLDGKNPRRITFSPYPEYAPDVLPNGRIVYSSVKRDGKKDSVGEINLHAVNIDGTDHMGYLTGNGTAGNKEMVKISPDRRVYFIHNENKTGPEVEPWPWGGRLAYVSQRRPEHTYSLMGSAQDGFYHSPCPLPGDGLLIAFRQKKKGSLYGLYRMEAGKNREKVYRSGDYHSIDAQVLTPHPVVKGRSSFVEHKLETGVLYCINVYISQQQQIRTLPPGTVKQVRVIEAVSAAPASGAPNATVTRKELGTAPVEQDGSFHIRVPAKTPIVFQLLDKDGNVLAGQKSWTWVQPRESRGCIGCHENRELAPPNRSMPKALTKPAVKLPGKKQKKGDR